MQQLIKPYCDDVMNLISSLPEKIQKNLFDKINGNILPKDYTDNFIKNDSFEFEIKNPSAKLLISKIKEKLILKPNEKIILIKSHQTRLRYPQTRWPSYNGIDYSEFLIVTNFSRLCYVDHSWEFNYDIMSTLGKNPIYIDYNDDKLKLDDIIINLIQVMGTILIVCPYLHGQNQMKIIRSNFLIQ